MPTPTSYIIYIDIHTAGPKDRGVKFANPPAVLEKSSAYSFRTSDAFWPYLSFRTSAAFLALETNHK